MHPYPTIKRFSQSVKSANQSVKSAKLGSSVSFADAVDYVSVVPYSEIYGWLPSTRVATCDGWKIVSAHACHFTGKLSGVIKMRLQQRALQHNKSEIDMFRRTMLRTCNV